MFVWIWEYVEDFVILKLRITHSNEEDVFDNYDAENWFCNWLVMETDQTFKNQLKRSLTRDTIIRDNNDANWQKLFCYRSDNYIHD